MSLKSAIRTLRTPFALDSAITLIATFGSAGLDLVIVALVSRVLQPAGFGVYAVYLTVMTLFGGAADLGLGLILTRFVAIYRISNPERALAYARLTFLLKLVVSILVVSIGTMTAPFLTRWLWGESGDVTMFVVAVWGATGLAMSTYVISWLRGSEQFLVRSGYVLFIAMVRLILITVLGLNRAITPASALIATGVAYVCTGGLGLFLLPRTALAVRRLDELRPLWREFAGFGKWVSAWFVLGAVIPRLDLLVLSSLAAHETTGWYAAAARLTAVTQLLNTSMMIVLVPKISRIDTDTQLKRLLNGWRTLSVVTLVVGLAPLELAAVPLVQLVYGKAYLPAVPIYQLLLLAAFLELIFNPLTYLHFTSDEPRAITVLNMLRLVVLAGGLWVLTPRYGGIGAAWAVVMSVVVAYGFLLIDLFARLVPTLRKRIIGGYG